MPSKRFLWLSGIWIGGCGHVHTSLSAALYCDSDLRWPWMQASADADDVETALIGVYKWRRGGGK